MKKVQPLSTRRLLGISLIALLALMVFSVSMQRGRAAGFTPVLGLWLNGGPQKPGAPLAGPVTVTATAGTTGPTDYATLGAAFAAVNAGTHQGVITVVIVGDTNEGATTATLNASGSGSASYTSISLQPSGGAARTITGATTAGSPMIDFNGADNVTIDGLNTGGNALTLSNTTVSGTAGTSTMRFINDATNNTVQNCTISGSETGTTSGTIFFSTTTGTTGNDGNVINSNSIGPAGSNLPTNGIFASGTTTTTALNNSGVQITNNKVFDFFNATAADWGILVSTGNTDWTITGNSLYQTATRTMTTAATDGGIQIANSSGNNFVISNNFIGGGAVSAGGSAWTIAGSIANRFRAISLSVGSTTPSSVQGNTVANFNFTSNSSATTAGGPWTGIYLTAGNANIGTTTGNTIGSGTGTGSITISILTNSGSISSGIFSDASPTTSSISNNAVGSISFGASTISQGFQGIATTTAASGGMTISGNTIGSTATANSINVNTGATSATNQIVRGINNTISTVAVSITNNTVANINNNYLPSAVTSTSNVVVGITSTAGINTITGNTVRNLTTAANHTGTNSSAPVIGILHSGTTAGQTISQNTIHSLSETHATAAVNVYGIYWNNSTTTGNLIERNLIHSLSATSTGAAVINGIYTFNGGATYRNNMVRLGIDAAGGSLTSGALTINGFLSDTLTTATNNWYFNSVFVGGTGVTAGTAATSVFKRLTSDTMDFRDNIAVNNRSNGAGTGKHYLMNMNATTTFTSNFNDFNQTGTGAVFGVVAATDSTTFANWKTNTSQDANSFFSDPMFIAPTGTSATVDLHISPSATTLIEGNGTNIVSVTNDFDGQTRATLTPVDIGADAGNFMGVDLSPPAINYTPLGNTTSTANRGLAASITDATGVPTAGVGLPVIYYRKGTSGAYSSTQSSFGGGSSYNFTIDYSLVAGGSVAVGDTIQYYVAAQDTAATPNVTTNPSAGAGGFTSNPPAASTPPTTPNSYKIAAAITGPKTVCASGCDYSSLTNANGVFDSINNGVLTGNTTINITGDLTGETGAVALNQWTEEGAGGYTLTIKPSGAARMVTGAVNGVLIKFNGASRVTIDGSMSGGSDQSLTIENTGATGPSVIVFGSVGTTPITNDTLKNCVVRNGANTSSAVVISDSTTVGNAGFFSNITVQNNNIQKAFVGVFATGGTIPQNGSNLTYTQNTLNASGANAIRDVGLYMQGVNGATVSQNTVANLNSADAENDVGIWLASGTINATVSNNTVSTLGYTGANTNANAPIGINVTSSTTGTNNNVTGNTVSDITSNGQTAVRGIAISGTTADLTVQKNKVQGVVNTNIGTFGAYGIDSTAGNNVVIRNNFVSNVNHDMTGGAAFSTTFGVFGIRVGAGTGILVYDNSVNLFGAQTGTAATSLLTAAFALVSTASTGCDVRNNVFANTISGGTTSIAHVSAYLPSGGTAAMNLTLNNNAYYSGTDAARQGLGQAGTTAGTGFYLASDFNAGAATPATNFRSYSSTLSAAGTNDNASLAATTAAPFVSNSDLHVTGANALLGAGVAIGSVTDDIDGDPRPASNTDIGADEVVQAVAGVIQGGTFYNVSVNDGDSASQPVTVTGQLTLNGKFDAGAGVNLGCNASVIGAGASNYVIGNLKKTYCSAGSFNFVVGTANGFSPVTVNITAGTFPADFTVRAVQGPQPNLGTPSLALQRYWTLTGTGMTADLTFNYLDPTDIPGTANESNFVIIKYDGSFTQPGGSVNAAANTASISGVTSFSDWTLGEPDAPTDVALNAFSAEGLSASPNAPQGGALLRWQTGMEVANLGFNLYRDEAGQRTRVNPNLIAGSAFFVGSRTVLGAGRSYAWRDTDGFKPAAQYWLEEVDLNGRSYWHGPVTAVGKASADAYEPNARLINELGDEQSADNTTHAVERFAPAKRVTADAVVRQQALTVEGAIKVAVNREGWYQIKAADLFAAGLDPRGDSRFLQLFVDGAEQPLNVSTNKDGTLAGVEFYGTGVDNAYTNERAYWLAVGATPGKRIAKVAGAAGAAPGGSFTSTVERRDRSLYFASLKNGERENFFGAVIVRDPLDQTLTLTRLAAKAAGSATLEVTLQGVTNTAHSVRVELNGAALGTLTFANQASAVARFNVTPAQLREGANTVRLVPLGGASDISLVDTLRVSYPRYYTADADALRFAAAGKQAVTVDGFSKPGVRVLDITDAGAVQEVVGAVQAQGGGYSVSLLVPGTGQRTLLAVASDLSNPAGVALSAASSWRQPNNGADMVVVTRKEFAAALDPLVARRKQQGLSVAVVDIESVYNEWGFGQKTPQALKDFLQYAATSWKKQPRYVLLAGDASYDPKGYIGAGKFDLVPTKLFDSQFLETASDDWFVDFNNDGVPELAIGRLPARTAAEALTMATKIAAYDSQSPADSLLLVSDNNDTYNFTGASEQLRALVPADVRVQSLHRGDADDSTTRAALIDAINGGQRVVNYVGHGSVNLWRGGVLGADDVSSLTNNSQLTVFVMMTCLNGYYHDAAIESLGERLLKYDRGGAVAVWASSGMTMPGAQAVMNQEAYRQLFGGQRLTIGEVMMRAKAAVNSGDVRRTWVLLGDPATRLR